MITAVIAGEIGFWVLLAAGLALRYLGHRQRLSTMVLLSLPLVDVALLAFSLIDLDRGHPATASHGIAAIYVGASVAFGGSMVAWADRRFAGKPRPPKLFGAAHAAHERRGWLGHLLAFALAAGVLGILTLVAAEPAPMWAPMWTWAGVVFADFLISFSYTVVPRKDPERAGHSGSDTAH
jgi:hypothetical protein